jgi:hypothetical protein
LHRIDDWVRCVNLVLRVLSGSVLGAGHVLGWDALAACGLGVSRFANLWFLAALELAFSDIVDYLLLDLM